MYKRIIILIIFCTLFYLSYCIGLDKTFAIPVQNTSNIKPMNITLQSLGNDYMYETTYDDKGLEIIKKHYKLPQKNYTHVIKYQYDQFGNMILQENFNSLGTRTYREEDKYINSKLIERIRTDENSVIKEVFDITGKNLLLYEMYYNGKLRSKVEKTYNNNGKLLTLKNNLHDKTKNDITQNTYDSKGNLTESIVTKHLETTRAVCNTVIKTNNIYDDKNNLISVIKTENGKITQKTNYAYDENNNMILSLNEEKGVKTKITSNYDNKKHLISKNVYQNDNATPVREEKYQYDSSGNKIYEKIIDRKNQTLKDKQKNTFSTVIKENKFVYNAKNKIIADYNYENKFLDKYEYNSKGQQLSRYRCNLDGTSCKPMDILKYDSKGRKIYSCTYTYTASLKKYDYVFVLEEFAFDDRGNEIFTRYKSADTDKIWEKTYDNYGNVITRKFCLTRNSNAPVCNYENITK